MKQINILLVFLMTVCAIQAQDSQSITGALVPFGEKIDGSGALETEDITEKYALLKANDTLNTKFKAIVTDVCQAKGCWMKLQLTDGNETMVRFKDYGFFMPKDIVGEEVIVNGKAFVEEMSVADQKHYAKDAGKSEAEIAKITASKKSFGFEADGVLLRQ